MSRFPGATDFHNETQSDILSDILKEPALLPCFASGEELRANDQNQHSAGATTCPLLCPQPNQRACTWIGPVKQQMVQYSFWVLFAPGTDQLKW